MKKINVVVFMLLAVNTIDSYANNQTVPVGDSPFYYQIGGGDDFALPPTMDSTTLHLKAESSLSVGSDCGVFNPGVTFDNYFNNGTYQVEKLTDQIVHSVTSAITEWPMYELSRIDPSLYNVLSNNVVGANEAFTLSTKSCNAMKRQIDNDENPYQNFASVSVNHQLKKQITLAKSNSKGDVVESMQDISKDGGDNGIPWVNGKDDGSGTKMAGGKGQPMVEVIHDTTVAGYNVLLNRDVNDNSTPSQNDNNAYLVSIWSSSDDAANWLVQTIGDINITTCDGCDKNQTPGHGLRYWIDVCTDNNDTYCAKNITQDISDLITGNEDINKDNLLAVSAPGVVINESVINAIKQMDATTQSIVVNKLGEEVSAQKVFGIAMLARRVLETGSEVPVIASDKPAQVFIHEGMKKLDDDIQSMTFEHNARREMMSNTVSAILDYNKAQNAESVTNLTIDSNPAPIMHGGALMESK